MHQPGPNFVFHQQKIIIFFLNAAAMIAFRAAACMGLSDVCVAHAAGRLCLAHAASPTEAWRWGGTALWVLRRLTGFEPVEAVRMIILQLLVLVRRKLNR